MAAVEIRGTLYDLASKSSRQVFLVGDATSGDGSAKPPPVISGGPIDPYPGHPLPGPQPPYPPVISGGPIDPYPGHPLPEPPTEPPTGAPDEDGFIKAPPAGGGWAYHNKYAWMYDPPADAPQPKA